MKRNRIFSLCVIAFIVLVILAACAPTPTATPVPPTKPPAPAATSAPTAATAPTATVAPTARPRTLLSIATGGTAGVYYPYGGGLAALISKNVTNVEASAEATQASAENMLFIQRGKSDLALALADTIYDAYAGQASFKDTGKVNVRALAVLYSNYMHLVATDESGIKTVADLKGKRVSVNTAGSGTEIIANRIMEAAGIDPEKDIQRQRLSIGESVNAMKDRKIDAFWWSGGLPTAGVTDLTSSPGLKVRFVANAEYISKMSEKYGPFYFKLAIPKGSYAGQDADVDTVGVANLLVVDEKFDAGLAHDILKMMVDKQADLGAVHSEAKKFGLPQATVGSPIPFHPGAVKFYAEKGITVK